MNEEPLTNEELTAALRKLQNDVLNLTERVKTLEAHYHTEETRRTEGTMTVVTPGGIAFGPTPPPSSPLPSRLVT